MLASRHFLTTPFVQQPDLPGDGSDLVVSEHMTEPVGNKNE
jgi:hypothetical protein